MDVEKPQRLKRLAAEVRGWLDFGCPEYALDKLSPLLRSPLARATGLSLRVRALVSMGEPEQALRVLRELRASYEDHDWLDLTEGWCRKRLGDLSGAIACMERMLARSSRSALAYFNLACYLALAGDRDRALDAIATACHLESRLRTLARSDSDLASLHGDPRFEKAVVSRET